MHPLWNILAILAIMLGIGLFLVVFQDVPGYHVESYCRYDDGSVWYVTIEACPLYLEGPKLAKWEIGFARYWGTWGEIYLTPNEEGWPTVYYIFLQIWQHFTLAGIAYSD